MTARAPRLIAGAAVLLILIGLGVVLIPSYTTNWKLQSYVNGLVEDSATCLLYTSLGGRSILR